MNISNWRDNEIRELLLVRADAEIARQIQGMARDLVVFDQFTNRLPGRGVIRIMSSLLHTLCQPSLKPNGIFPTCLTQTISCCVLHV